MIIGIKSGGDKWLFLFYRNHNSVKHALFIFVRLCSLFNNFSYLCVENTGRHRDMHDIT